MDYIEGLAKQASQLTMYDIKSYYNQARNAVLNVSEMEGKVREATNDDPWGASSTLMQQIADGTHNFQHFNEIMPTIYSRFMEKEAREWRQIYKALTLLEFLVKNGSERVVDDARAHISTIKMLRSFHYIDEKGKDQGINVRNRASEIASLLGDVDRIRAERRKAKANKNKYQGTGNEGGMSFATASGGRYGGFGSESLGYPGGGGSSSGGGGGEYGRDDRYRGDRSGEREWGSRADEYSARPRASRQAAPEYDEYEGADDLDTRRPTSASASGSASTSRPSSARPQPPPKARAQAPSVQKEEEKPKKEVNLFDFGDDDVMGAPAPMSGGAIGGQGGILGGDDDFDDFQTAPSAAPISSPPIQPSHATAAGSGNAGLFNLLNTGANTSPAPAASSSAGTNSFTMAPPLAPAGGAGIGASKPNYNSSTFSSPSAPTATTATNSAGPAKGSTFDDLFTTSLSSISTSAKPTATGPAKGKSISEMQQEKANAQLWGGQTGQAPGQQQSKGSGGFDDLLF